MSAVVVKYFVQRKLKKGEKSLPRSVFIIPPHVVARRGQLTRSLLLECLPLDGAFHVRAKNLLTQGGADDRYFWLDLTDDSVEVPRVRGMVHLKCLPTAAVTSNESQLASSCSSDWLQDPEQMANLRNSVDSENVPGAVTMSSVGRSLQKTLGNAKKTFGNLGDKMKAMIKDGGEAPMPKLDTEAFARNMNKAGASVKKGFSSFLSAMKKGIGKVGRSIPLKPSAKASMVLHMLHYDLHSQLDLGDTGQVDVLRRLWNVLASIDASGAKKNKFGPKSNFWLKLGFEGPEPAALMRPCGVLGLKCLAYMADNYSPHFKMMVKSQLQKSKKNKFPVATVAVALTLDLASTLELAYHGEYTDPGPKVFWRMFEDNTAFFELFAISLTMFNHMHSRGSTTATSQALSGVGQKIQELLGQGPSTVKDMRAMASRMRVLFI